MPKFLSDVYINQIAKKRIRNYPLLYMVIVFLAFMYIDVMYRYFNNGILFDPDIIHILFIDLTLTLSLMVFIGIIPTVAKKYIISFVLMFFAMMSFFYTTLGFEGVVQTTASGLDTLNILKGRFVENFQYMHLLLLLPMFVGSIPMRIKYTVPKYLIMVSLLIVSVFAGSWYLQSTKYNSPIEVTNNYERIYYNDEGDLLFTRLGSNIGLLRNMIDFDAYNVKTESYINEASEFIKPNYFYNSHSSNFKDKNLVIIEIENLDYIAIREDVMPTLWALSKTGMEFVNYFDEQTLDQNFELMTGIQESSKSLNTIYTYGQNSYPNSLGNQFRYEGYQTTFIESQKGEFLYETEFIKRMGYNLYYDSRSYDGKYLNSLGLATNAATSFFEYRQYYTHFKFTDLANQPMTFSTESEPINLDVPEELLNYFSYANVVDQAIDRILESISIAGDLDNTVILVTSTGHPDYFEDDLIREYSTARDGLYINRVPFMMWDGVTREVITEPMGPVNVPATLSNMFSLRNVEFVGPDIFDTGKNVVSLNDRTWYSEAGYYDSSKQTFTVIDEKFITDYLDEFIAMTNEMIYDRYLYSRIILENNYFALKYI